jgi:hypothetical protein
MERRRDVSSKEEGDPLLKICGVLRGAIPEGAAAFLRELRRDKQPGEIEGGEGARLIEMK